MTGLLRSSLSPESSQEIAVACDDASCYSGRNPPTTVAVTAQVRNGNCMKILVIEDDSETGSFLKKGLQEAGHIVDLAVTGRDGLVRAVGEPYEIIIADRRLPGVDGLALVKTIRGAGIMTPVMFLTTMTGVG